MWLVLLAMAYVLALLALWRLALHTWTGQWLDTVALTGSQIGRHRIDEPVERVLDAVSVVSLLAATAVIGFIALLRRRIALAVTATALIVGANVTTQLIKYGLDRPEYGIDPQRAAVGNSLPSGHACVAASVAVALVLVLPRRVRALGAFLGAAYAAVNGVATLSAGWHRPSDAVAAFLVVGGWAAAGGLLLVVTQGDQDQVDPADAHRRAALALGIIGLALMVVSVVAMAWLDGQAKLPAGSLTRRPLFVGYAGSAAGIAGTMGVVMALVLASVHRLVPRFKG